MRFLKIFFTAACLILFSSCIMSVSNESFNSKMDLSDSYIAQAQFSSAEKILLKALKIAHSDFQYLGIYRRFALMQNTKLCEEVISRAYKKNPQSIEVRAVYTNFLIQQKRYEEAAAMGKNLSGTVYGSLYSHAVLLLTKDKEDYFSQDLIKIYSDAYNTTGNNSFIINAAVILALQGNYSEAMIYHPQKITVYDPVLFWAGIAYDAGNYAVCLYDLSVASQTVQSELLKADAYVLSGEIERARESWLWTLDYDTTSPSAYLNAAASTENLGDFKGAGDYARKMVILYPDYIPGLIYYGNYALRQNRSASDDLLSQALKPTGLKSLQMHIDESFPVIPISDALYRIDEALAKNKDAYLQVERLKLDWANRANIQVQDKVIDVWRLLEKNMKEAFVYDEEILRYAVWFFLAQSKFEEAESMLMPYIREKYGEKVMIGEDSYELHCDPVLVKEKLTGWERESLSYLYAVYLKNYTAALALLEYEYEQYSSNEVIPYLNTNKKNEQMCMNLANIYEGLKYYDKATAVYSEIASLTESPETKAEIHYRLACINLLKKEIKNAVLNLEYSLSLNPDNSKARLLLKKIR